VEATKFYWSGKE